MTGTLIPSTYGNIEILAPLSDIQAEILTPEALKLVAKLHKEFDDTRKSLLTKRQERQKEIDAGARPDFLAATRSIRESDWKVSPPPSDLVDRRVEITGPVDRKMVINALNSDVKVFMADFEDATSPTWENVVSGQVNLRDAVRRTIQFKSPEGKEYRLVENPAVLLVRPRGWHLNEKHVLIDGRPVAGSLFDFGLYFYHNAKALLDRNTGPYFYLPKLESHLEARLWNDVFLMAQQELGLSRGTIKATVLIETILAAFEMDEILYELRDHSAGLNCGRWDYIFSCIKKFRRDGDFCLADRGLVTMSTDFMRDYSLLTIKTCHRRGAHAIGGMAAQIPIKNDPVANEEAMAKVRADKEREADNGHDGTWVAHPGLAPIAMTAFNRVMTEPNQVQRMREDVSVTPSDLLAFGPDAPITEQGLRINCNVGIQYLGSWLSGSGCVPIYNLMEDTATAEICRSQIWQWINTPKGVLDDGRRVTVELFRKYMQEEMVKIQKTVPSAAAAPAVYKKAADLMDSLVTSSEFIEFLTLPGYDLL